MATYSRTIEVDMDGNIKETIVTVRTPEEYLLEAGQVYAYQVQVKGRGAGEKLLQLIKGSNDG